MEPAHRIVLGPTQEQLSGYHPEDVDLKCGFPEEVAAAARKASREDSFHLKKRMENSRKFCLGSVLE